RIDLVAYAESVPNTGVRCPRAVEIRNRDSCNGYLCHGLHCLLFTHWTSAIFDELLRVASTLTSSGVFVRRRPMANRSKCNVDESSRGASLAPTTANIAGNNQ